ncbi:hypothetical protein FGB62_98g063 [Gracilaria domingensis]|nr:hypothetical protein FGB62_98g063 [Gracilaria domingensis]
MHVKELAARFERPAPAPVQNTSSNAVPAAQLSGSSVSELRKRLEQAVIEQQHQTQNDAISNRHAETVQHLPPLPHVSTTEVRGLPAPASTTAPNAPLPSDVDVDNSTIASTARAAHHYANEHTLAPADAASTNGIAQHMSRSTNVGEHPHVSVPSEEQLESEPKEPTRISSEFTSAYSTHSGSTASGSTAPPASDFVPQTIDDVGIIPDVSEGELDDIDGIERVEDYDSQEDSRSSGSSSDCDTFQRAETLSDPQVSYRTEGGESLHIVDGSYSYHESDGSYRETTDDESDCDGEHHKGAATAEGVDTLKAQDQPHQTYSGYSYSPNTAPLSSFHTSTIHSQVLFSRATTRSTSDGFQSANDDFASESERIQRTSPLSSKSRMALQANTSTRYNPTIAFSSVRSPPPAPSPPTSPRVLYHSAPLETTRDNVNQDASEEEVEQVNSGLRDRGRLYAQGSVKRLPKAKVLIARRRGQSVNLDTSAVGNSDVQPLTGAAVSADEIGRRRLVREISNPGAFFAGQVSMVQRTSEKDVHTPEASEEEDGSPPSPRRKPFGELGTFHSKHLRQDAFRKRYDEYLDAEDLNRAPDSNESSASESELLGESGASKMKYRPRMKLFGRKNAQLEKDRLRAKRHERRKEDIARRSTILSGALDRVSMAADPWIDFITDAKAMPVPEKARGSLRRAVKRLFGSKGKHQTLIRE